jgi:hypothetical protein
MVMFLGDPLTGTCSRHVIERVATFGTKNGRVTKKLWPVQNGVSFQKMLTENILSMEKTEISIPHRKFGKKMLLNLNYKYLSLVPLNSKKP